MARAEFRAGIAVRVVTPDPLLPVSGGVGPSHPAREKKGDLTVRALVMERDGVRVAVVATDFLGFPAVLGDRVRARVTGIPPENILIGASHTHSAPDCYGFPDGRGGTGADLKYLDWVCDQAAAAIREALQRLEPAAVRIATGEARGRIAYNYYAEQLYDPRCHVVQFVAVPEGRVIATLVNYAIHPEVLGPDQGILSPDLVGPLYDRLAERGGGTGLFMNSAQGGMVTADNRTPDGGERRTWDECQRIGRLLADEALRIVREAPLQEDPPLACFSRVIRLPLDSPELRFVLTQSPLYHGPPDADHVQTRLNLVNLGNAQMLTIPGEALPNLGFYLKRKMHGEHNFLFGLTNDAFGYLMSKYDWRSFKRYDYISRVCLGEMAGEIYVTEALKLVESAPAPVRAAAR
ncbi:MAG: hypothetical protein D6766_08660 [Verrucomicrobia bacterium]|nr:MAG: hypothetical protein D6766_08660 [Verrucomicrobiota bacterium]